jgi:hypothetical protein
MVQLSFPAANRDPAVFPDAGRVVIDRSPPSHLSKMITSRTDRMPYANVNGQRLYYEDTGGTGPAIIFSHGILLDGTMFAPQVAALRDKYRCIVWDERGHGKTAGETLRPFSTTTPQTISPLSSRSSASAAPFLPACRRVASWGCDAPWFIRNVCVL